MNYESTLTYTPLQYCPAKYNFLLYLYIINFRKYSHFEKTELKSKITEWRIGSISAQTRTTGKSELVE